MDPRKEKIEGLKGWLSWRFLKEMSWHWLLPWRYWRRKESKEDDSEEEGFLGAENIVESEPEFKELLRTSESDIENTEQEQKKESGEGFVLRRSLSLKG